MNVSAEKSFREIITEAGFFQEAALLQGGHHGRGNNLSSSVEIRKHIASQGSAGVVSTVGAEQDA